MLRISRMSAVAISSVLIFAAVLLAVSSAGQVWDSVTRKYIADLTPLLDALSLDQQHLIGYLRIWGIALVGAFVMVAFVLRMPPVALAAVYLVYVSPRIILELMIRQGLETVSTEIPQPLAAEFQRIVRDYEHGRPLAEALRDARQRLNIDSFTLFTSAVLVSLERGGKITDSLERISHSLQEIQRVERKLEVDTASGQMVVNILTCFPVFFIGLSYFVNPEGTMVVFTSLLGQLVLLVVIGLTYFSFRWSQRILAIEV
jgi:tight adherence protein B